MKKATINKYLKRVFVVVVLGYIAFEFYRWPSAAAETSYMLLCEADFAAKVGGDVQIRYGSATTGRFGKWQVSLVLEPEPETLPARKVYCSYDRSGLMHLQDIRSGFVYNRDDPP